jgi:hypothetical protein
MDSAPWTISASQKSRREPWKAIRLWLVPLTLGAVGFYLPFWLNRDHIQTRATSLVSNYQLSSEDETVGQLTLGLISFIAIGATITRITLDVRRYYRYPKCDVIPMSSSDSLGSGSFGQKWGVALNRSACTNCGAPLR